MSPRAPWLCHILEKLVLRDGVEIVRQRTSMTRVPHAADLMRDFMEPLAGDLDEARRKAAALAVHGLEGGRAGHFVVPVESIAFAEIVVLNTKGDPITVAPGWAGDADDLPAQDDDPPRPIVRNLRSVAPHHSPAI